MELQERYDKTVEQCKNLLLGRNNDYGDSYKMMDIYSISRLVMMKLDRIKSDNISKEKIRDECRDCINYLILALTMLEKEEDKHE